VSIEEALRDRLLGLAGVTALVSARVYLLKLPQSPTYPAVRIQPVGEFEEYHLRGRERILRSRVQVDAFTNEGSVSDPYGTAAALADAIAGDGNGDVATGLSGFVGDLGGSPPALHIAMCQRLERRVLYDPEELRVVRMVQDFDVHWWAL
jgi:hypothetical protein